MALYHKFEDVRVRLIGKLRFTDSDEDENRFNISLAKRLMNEAEGKVELDLSPRYAAPFQTDAGEQFSALPLRPTQEILRTLCELQSVIRILGTDFGRGTVSEGDKYAESSQKAYDKIVETLLDLKSKESYRDWANPPLTGLRLNYMNTEGDDGYSGQVINTSTNNDDAFPRRQINNPAQTFWNATIDDVNCE